MATLVCHCCCIDVDWWYYYIYVTATDYHTGVVAVLLYRKRCARRCNISPAPLPGAPPLSQAYRPVPCPLIPGAARDITHVYVLHSSTAVRPNSQARGRGRGSREGSLHHYAGLPTRNSPENQNANRMETQTYRPSSRGIMSYHHGYHAAYPTCLIRF